MTVAIIGELQILILLKQNTKQNNTEKSEKINSFRFGRLDNATRWINFCLVDSVVRFAITYPLDSDLSVRYRYPTYTKLGPEHYLKTCMYIL